MVTSRMLGVFRSRPETRNEFLSALNLRSRDLDSGRI
jgi:GTP cyclohydrolase I